MIVVKVTYTVKEGYINTNKELIRTFLQNFEMLDKTLFQYSVFLAADGATFIHISQYKNKEIQEILLNIPSFLRFQEERDKNLVSQPQIEFLDYVGGSRDVY
ncbi:MULTISPECIES: hypothetical protein [Sphingobacterium]|uniref:hypothetical protein n=1 Tax=Sphingobacterium TaxID=28453 RepID=UPI0013D989C6|nr:MULTISPECIES: hypothetical protein [unclassified Sphingobacterium]